MLIAASRWTYRTKVSSRVLAACFRNEYGHYPRRRSNHFSKLQSRCYCTHKCKTGHAVDDGGVMEGDKEHDRCDCRVGTPTKGYAKRVSEFSVPSFFVFLSCTVSFNLCFTPFVFLCFILSTSVALCLSLSHSVSLCFAPFLFLHNTLAELI
jgi:hypothetical protein